MSSRHTEPEVSPSAHADSTAPNPRTDVHRDPRRLLLYFIGLVVVYIAGVFLLRPSPDNGNSQNWAYVVMAAPTVGALLARFAGPGVIQWGRLSWWIPVGLVPVGFGLAGYWVASSLGFITAVPELISAAMTGALLSVPFALISAAGEEIGWRGFLWPLMRRRMHFIAASAIVTAVWWAYHIPVVLLGWYGNAAGLPAFTVAIIGFGAFVGVLTDRSRSIWPSVVAHGGWNALVATAFVGGFTGSATLIGEFGWVAAFSMVALGVVSVAWHLATGGGARMPYLST